MFANYRSSLLSIAVITLATVAALAAPPNYHIVNTYKIGGEGGWDYLTSDSGTRRLYISRSTHVIVLDLDSGKTIGEISGTPGVHGIALAPEFNRGFSSNGADGTVSIFDIKTLATGNKIKVGEGPDAILYDSASSRVFTFNGRGHDLTVIDAAKGTVTGTIKLDGRPEFATADGKGEVFVNIEDKGELVAIDSNKMEIKHAWLLAPCESPSGLSMDRKNRRLFVGCDNKMMAVVNADNGKIVATLPIGEGVDATVFDDETQLAFASCGVGTLTVVHEDSPDKFSVFENLPTQPGARTMAVDSKTHNVFLVTAKFGPPPAPTAENPHPRHTILPDSFVVLVVGQ